MRANSIAFVLSESSIRDMQPSPDITSNLANYIWWTKQIYLYKGTSKSYIGKPPSYFAVLVSVVPIMP